MTPKYIAFDDKCYHSTDGRFLGLPNNLRCLRELNKHLHCLSLLPDGNNVVMFSLLKKSFNPIN